MKTAGRLFLLLLWSGILLAQGRIVIPEAPEQFRPHQVYLQKVDATVHLKQGVGNITLKQEFMNKSPFRLEGEYLFAIPDEAQVHDFHLYINGKKTRGQVLNSREAARIYRDIVRRLRDPALLEYTGYGLLKARVFPIEPRKSRRIELSYAQVVPYQNNSYKFTLPIRQCRQASISEFHLSIRIESDRPIGNIYSPSHSVRITRGDERHATVSLKANDLETGRDFVLYYSPARQEIDATVISFRPRTDRDGFFILMATPGFAMPEKKMVPKDVIFVVDVSGSMAGQKIKQAREALRFCLNSLEENDRFEIIRFSSEVEGFRNGLIAAGEEEKKNALYFIDNLEAAGGTNINDALLQAMGVKNSRDNRPTSIVFLTDGLPTEGVTEVKQILQNVKATGKNFIRIFSFGMGYDVNTFLLDKLSLDFHGSANYVKPGENIEKEVSGFFAKISQPVLTDLQIDFGEGEVYDIYPTQLPDIFRGQRVTLFGRYRKPGKAEITLTGRQGGSTRRFAYTVTFAEREQENEFIAKLWANRKVAYLLEKIRFEGENPELVKSIEALGKKYGIVTPYTSFLVTEQEKELAQIQNQVIRIGADATNKKIFVDSYKLHVRGGRARDAIVGSSEFLKALSAAPKAAAQSSGEQSVMASRARNRLRSAEQDTDMLLIVRYIGGKTFRLKDGLWQEMGLDGEVKPDRTVKFLSKAYFELSKKDRLLAKILSIGEEVLFRWEGKVYRIVPE